MNHYITEIKIEELRHLSDICIELNRDRRVHLLLTGKNGSGKTTVLRALKKYLSAIADNKLENLEKNYKEGISVDFNETAGLCRAFREGQFILAFYGADRKTGIIKQNGAEDVVLDTSYSLEENPGQVLLKYLVHLKTQQAYARNEGDIETVQMLDQWFERFVSALKVLLDNQSIELRYDYKNYNFEIKEDGRNAFGFDQLSDGYSAAIQIVADLILRMEQNWLKKGILSSYDAEGIVLIDELETHLHIGLQKTILPFLTEFFPGIQFIVSTHSPYILNSVGNCVIYDLENKFRMEDMSGYSAEGIVEGYFEQDSYSDLLLRKVKRYGELVELKNPTDDERAERAVLLMEMKQLSGDLARDARNAFEEIEDRRKRNDKV
ncbi:AAA family ATPase [Roseburia hominis]